MTNPVAPQAARVGVLLSRSTTTGWLDWMHGEMWLFENGILRIPIGWILTILCVGYFFNPQKQVTRSFTDDEFARLLNDRRVRWIPRDQLASAELRHTVGADELRAQLIDGQQVQLLWLRQDGAYYALQQPLWQWLGHWLTVID